MEIIGYNRSVKSKVTGRTPVTYVPCFLWYQKLTAHATFLVGIEMFHKILEEANAGDQMGVLIRGLKRDDVRRGMVVAKPGSLKQHEHAQAQVYIMTKDEGGLAQPVTHERNLTMFSKTWDASAMIELSEGKEMIMPGEDGSITIKLNKPMVMEKNQTFTLRGGGGTIGTGKVIFFLYLDSLCSIWL